MILPTNQPENWIRKYADRVATLKKLSPQQFGRCRNAIKSAFGKIYRGVVLDVDGTIVDYTKGEVDPELATLIGDLLRHGVPVILMSGRGRGAMRMAANSIRQQSRMPLWYLRRLQCVTHNGTYLLYTNTSSPEKFLEQEMQLGRFHINFEKLKYRLLTICADLCKYVCKHAAIDCVSSIVKISMYSGSDENREKIYSGNQSYLREVVQSVPTPVFTGGSIEGNMDGRLCVLLDDNCTTCATLQLARDVLFFKNAHTIGAVVVRYPGINR